MLIKYFRFAVYGLVFIGFSCAKAGAYDDFFRAIISDDARTVRALLQRGFDPNTLAPDLRHGLMMALALPTPAKAVAEALVDSSATNLNIRNTSGETPLMMAALKGQLDLARKMIDRGADVNQPGWAPLHYAATHGSPELVTLLLDQHAYVDAESPNGTTPLMMAAQYGSTEAVKRLLEAGAQPLQKNRQGLSALDFAQRGSRRDAVELISAAVRAQAPRGVW